jgi:hypothetical protein
MRSRPPRRVALRASGALLAAASLAATGCLGESEPEVETVHSGSGLEQPTGLAFRPGVGGELWVTNRGDDSIAIVSDPGGEASVDNRRDAYAEHFVARPSGIAFDRTGRYFAVANDSNNEVRGMVFKLNPERNRFFKDNNFMGPALFASETYALAGQGKRYLEDWPQPGYGHDPPDDLERHECPDEYWSREAEACVFPREGSHLDMLHGSPLSAGILNDVSNVYYVLDGCGGRTAQNRCRGDGHVVMVDFNRDHQEGNGFHGDGVIRRYVDAPFRRVAGVASGIVEHDGSIYYADTGAGVVRRLDPASGEREVLVGPWHPGPATHHEQGTGITDWSHAAHAPADGDDPAAVDEWIVTAGDSRLIVAAGPDWIRPMETLGEYSYVRGAVGEAVTQRGDVQRPAGLAADDDHLYIADNATGEIHAFAWDGLQPESVLETGAESLSGLAIDPSNAGWLYFTDTAGNSVGRVEVDG